MENQAINEPLIVVGKDFTDTPIGRYKKESCYSGEAFRDDFLIPALLKGKVCVDLAQVEGYGSSFLEEVFGGVVRANILPSQELRARLRIVSSDMSLQPFADRAIKYFNDAIMAREDK